MGKLTIDNLAAVLEERNGLSKQEAQAFVSALFEVIQVGIEKDGLVKVKGLGTFKVVGVDARESVNVNTGERVLIDSHSKISFTPDATMKELVNKPFSGFETVVLNEGVEFDDMLTDMMPETVTAADDETEETSEKTIQQEAPEKNIQQEAPTEVTENPIVEFVDEEESEPATVEKETAPENETTQTETSTAQLEGSTAQLEASTAQLVSRSLETPETEPVSEPVAVEETKQVELEEPEEEETDTMIPQEKTIPWLLILISLIAGFGLGYIVRDLQEPTYTYVREKIENQVDTVKTPAAADSLQAVTTDTIPAVVTDTVSTPVVAKPVRPAEEPEYMKYEAMDSRLRHGAYYIVGTASVEKVREGDTPDRVSRRYLGRDMACYLEVYNGINSSTQLKAGQEIKIPKLMTKKAMRERIARQNKNK